VLKRRSRARAVKAFGLGLLPLRSSSLFSSFLLLLLFQCAYNTRTRVHVRIKQFLKAWWSDWFTRMAGPAMVPFAIAALYVYPKE
jgi:hypothetical protein